MNIARRLDLSTGQSSELSSDSADPLIQTVAPHSIVASPAFAQLEQHLKGDPLWGWRRTSSSLQQELVPALYAQAQELVMFVLGNLIGRHHASTVDGADSDGSALGGLATDPEFRDALSLLLKPLVWRVGAYAVHAALKDRTAELLVTRAVSVSGQIVVEMDDVLQRLPTPHGDQLAAEISASLWSQVSEESDSPTADDISERILLLAEQWTTFTTPWNLARQKLSALLENESLPGRCSACRQRRSPTNGMGPNHI
jgi:hypothetical protein